MASEYFISAKDQTATATTTTTATTKVQLPR